MQERSQDVFRIIRDCRKPIKKRINPSKLRKPRIIAPIAVKTRRMHAEEKIGKEDDSSSVVCVPETNFVIPLQPQCRQTVAEYNKSGLEAESEELRLEQVEEFIDSSRENEVKIQFELDIGEFLTWNSAPIDQFHFDVY